MRFDNFILPCITILLILLNSNDGHGQQLICENRNPEGHTGIKRNGDGGYKIVIQGPHSLQGQYVPNEVYTSKFLAFLFAQLQIQRHALFSVIIFKVSNKLKFRAK